MGATLGGPLGSPSLLLCVPGQQQPHPTLPLTPQPGPSSLLWSCPITAPLLCGGGWEVVGVVEAKLGSRRGEPDSTLIFGSLVQTQKKLTCPPSSLDLPRGKGGGGLRVVTGRCPWSLSHCLSLWPHKCTPPCRWCQALLAALPQAGGQCCLSPCLTYPPSCYHIFVLSFYFFLIT